jgi:D-inositol-3-phosphate glycosyltransferase
MRVAMLSYHTCPLATLGGKDTGGMNVYVRELTRSLGRLGVQVDVFTRSQDEHVPHVLHDLGYGNRVVHVPAGPEIPLDKETLAGYLPQFIDGVLAFGQAKNPRPDSSPYDIIHSHYWMSGVAGLKLRTAWSAPVVHMFHTLGLMKQRVARSAAEAEGDYRLDGERRVLRQADRIIAATPAELAQLQWLYQAETDKIVIIPPGVDTSHFYPIPQDEAREFTGVPPCERLLLFVGRIEPLKGIETLLQALAYLNGRGVPVCLMLIGGDQGGVEIARLQALRQQMGLSELVVFAGKRSQDTLPYYYSSAQALVVPSHYESFGMVALEAMACGVPVVASQVGGLAFLVRDGVTGFTVPVDDPLALAEKLELLITNPELRQRLGEQAAGQARAYAWEVIAGRILHVYHDLLAPTGASHPGLRPEDLH